MHDRTVIWLARFLLFRFAVSAGMELGRSYFYKKVMAQQERGGRAWRVVHDVIKHPNGSVTNRVIEKGLRRPEALKLTRKLNEAKPS